MQYYIGIDLGTSSVKSVSYTHLGVFLCMAKEGRQIFVMGHPEYDRVTLDAEYKLSLIHILAP